MEILHVEKPGPGLREAILAPLVAYNESGAGPSRWVPVALVVQDEAGAVIGGLWGDCFYDWLHVHLLVVPEHARGTGVGTRLLQQGEAIARSREAVGVFLDTFSFQARGFYEKLGYSCFGELVDHPRGGHRFFMQKRLA